MEDKLRSESRNGFVVEKVTEDAAINEGPTASLFPLEQKTMKPEETMANILSEVTNANNVMDVFKEPKASKETKVSQKSTFCQVSKVCREIQDLKIPPVFKEAQIFTGADAFTATEAFQTTEAFTTTKASKKNKDSKRTKDSKTSKASKTPKSSKPPKASKTPKPSKVTRMKTALGINKVSKDTKVFKNSILANVIPNYRRFLSKVLLDNEKFNRDLRNSDKINEQRLNNLNSMCNSLNVNSQENPKVNILALENHFPNSPPANEDICLEFSNERDTNKFYDMINLKPFSEMGTGRDISNEKCNGYKIMNGQNNKNEIVETFLIPTVICGRVADTRRIEDNFSLPLQISDLNSGKSYFETSPLNISSDKDSANVASSSDQTPNIKIERSSLKIESSCFKSESTRLNLDRSVLKIEPSTLDIEPSSLENPSSMETSNLKTESDTTTDTSCVLLSESIETANNIPLDVQGLYEMIQYEDIRDIPYESEIEHDTPVSALSLIKTYSDSDVGSFSEEDFELSNSSFSTLQNYWHMEEQQNTVADNDILTVSTEKDPEPSTVAVTMMDISSAHSMLMDVETDSTHIETYSSDMNPQTLNSTTLNNTDAFQVQANIETETSNKILDSLNEVLEELNNTASSIQEVKMGSETETISPLSPETCSEISASEYDSKRHMDDTIINNILNNPIETAIDVLNQKSCDQLILSNEGTEAKLEVNNNLKFTPLEKPNGFTANNIPKIYIEPKTSNDILKIFSDQVSDVSKVLNDDIEVNLNNENVQTLSVEKVPEITTALIMPDILNVDVLPEMSRDVSDFSPDKVSDLLKGPTLNKRDIEERCEGTTVVPVVSEKTTEISNIAVHDVSKGYKEHEILNAISCHSRDNSSGISSDKLLNDQVKEIKLALSDLASETLNVTSVDLQEVVKMIPKQMEAKIERVVTFPFEQISEKPNYIDLSIENIFKMPVEPTTAADATLFNKTVTVPFNFSSGKHATESIMRMEHSVVATLNAPVQVIVSDDIAQHAKEIIGDFPKHTSDKHIEPTPSNTVVPKLETFPFQQISETSNYIDLTMEDEFKMQKGAETAVDDLICCKTFKASSTTNFPSERLATETIMGTEHSVVAALNASVQIIVSDDISKHAKEIIGDFPKHTTDKHIQHSPSNTVEPKLQRIVTFPFEKISEISNYIDLTIEDEFKMQKEPETVVDDLICSKTFEVSSTTNFSSETIMRTEHSVVAALNAPFQVIVSDGISQHAEDILEDIPKLTSDKYLQPTSNRVEPKFQRVVTFPFEQISEKPKYIDLTIEDNFKMQKEPETTVGDLICNKPFKVPSATHFPSETLATETIVRPEHTVVATLDAPVQAIVSSSSKTNIKTSLKTVASKIISKFKSGKDSNIQDQKKNVLSKRSVAPETIVKPPDVCTKINDQTLLNNNLENVNNFAAFSGDKLASQEMNITQLDENSNSQIALEGRKRKCTYEDDRGTKLSKPSSETSSSATLSTATLSSAMEDMDQDEIYDNVNPNWALHRSSTPSECFKLVHNQWKSSKIPDPHKDLTTRYQTQSWRNMSVRAERFKGDANKFTVSCGFLFTEKIKNLQEQISKLQVEIDQLYQSKRKHKNFCVNNRLTDAINKREELKRQITNLCKKKNEMDYLYSFYKGSDAISEQTEQEILNQYHILDKILHFYKRHQ